MSTVSHSLTPGNPGAFAPRRSAGTLPPQLARPSPNPEGCQKVAGGRAPATPPDLALKPNAPRRGARSLPRQATFKIRPNFRRNTSVPCRPKARSAGIFVALHLGPSPVRGDIFVASPSQNQSQLRQSGIAPPPRLRTRRFPTSRSRSVAVGEAPQNNLHPVGRLLPRRPDIVFRLPPAPAGARGAHPLRMRRQQEGQSYAWTTMPLAWIAERLAMGSRGYLTWLLYRQGNPP